MALIALTFLLIGIILLWRANQQRHATGLPGGQVIYADTRKWGPVEEPLYDAKLELSGRPDYLVQDGKMVIPVEVKSSRVTDAPYDSHIFQLAAYCYLVNSSYGIRPSHGILNYPNRTYRIDYTPKLEAELIDLVVEMRTKGHLRKINRSHDSARRCDHCGYRSTCDQRL
ncbi:MAG: CRISPR-associated protein Cas4 [Anaerolineales bacterium]|nr:CRISPR-associated protein Cas4 [Chloroflexota bacterium]MBL6981192.1 CRISPR-associated protein Cas4 [Anaerolineales bacterium]